MTISPFHRGEIDIQDRLGKRSGACEISHLIENSIASHAADFIRRQSMLWVGVEANESFMLAFPLFGSPGFINPHEGDTIEIELNEHFPIPDQWFRHLKPGKNIGCLMIEFSTRRRFRVNGVINTVNESSIEVTVQQAYPNCSKYLTKRKMLEQPTRSQFHLKSSGSILSEALIKMIIRSDTAFVASLGPNGADVSHRGGPKGFIRCHAPDKIMVPDYQGNGFFNTLGNFRENPFAGVTIVDFNRGYFLQLSGEIKMIFDMENKMETTNSAWELSIHRWHAFKLEGNIKWNPS